VKCSDGEADKHFNQPGRCDQQIEGLYRFEAISQLELNIGEESHPAINSNILVIAWLRAFSFVAVVWYLFDSTQMPESKGTSLWKSAGLLILWKSLLLPISFVLLFCISFKSDPWNSDFQKDFISSKSS